MFYNLVNCLHDADPYRDYRVEEVVRDITSRMRPMDLALRVSGSPRQFRLKTQSEIAKPFNAFIPQLHAIFTKVLSIPRWHHRHLSFLVDAAESSERVLLVLDTNFLIQSITKDLPLEHFYPNLQKQHPHIGNGSRGLAMVVVPFTVLMETYRVILSPGNGLSYSVRVRLWSRMISLVRQDHVHVLSLPVEFNASAMSILTRMAYHKAFGDDGNLGSRLNPDRHILNVCLYLQYLLRSKQACRLCGSSIPEGTLLFSFLKYHVRRFDNTVKGSATDGLILFTMDQKFSRAAYEAGVDCFPTLMTTK
ncbi:unnamed protein product [Phytomonas sp. Hart1]|nr:unnamed protein product [Phytomonas sp. Hart1]|eukprot:CCW68461.1 unnamed protein product [Phytomonas sp. isolate Hart1]